MKQKKKNIVINSLAAKNYNTNLIYLSIIVIAVLCLLIYYQSLNFHFTTWDDEEMVVNNHLVYGLSFGKLWEIFSTIHMSQYHPLVVISYALENSFFGMNPAVYHSTNLILHILNSVLVFFIILSLGNNTSIAFFTGVLFAVHPVHVESVVWITERKDMLYSLFYQSAVLYYINMHTGINRGRKVWLYLLFIFSCLSKTSAVTLPAVLVLIDYYYDKKFILSKLKEKIPLFAISFIFGVLNYYAQYKELDTGGTLGLPEFDIIQRIFIMFNNYNFYIIKIFWPANLSAFYPYPETLNLIFYLAPFGVIALILFVKYSLKNNHIAVFGILFYTITILPVLQLLPVGRAVSADRFAYIPSIGIIFIFISGVYYLSSLTTAKKKLMYMFYAVMIPLTVISMILAYYQAQIWKDNMTLYSDMITKNPESFIAYNNRGVIYAQNGNLNAAEPDFLNAIKYNSKYPAAYNNLGMLKQQKNDFGGSIEYFNKAISLNPGFEQAYFNIGMSYFSLNEYDSSIAAFNKVLKINPRSAQAYNSLGRAYGTLGKNNDAILFFSKSIEADPGFSAAYYNLGVTYINSGDEKKGIDNIIMAARLGNKNAGEYLKSKNITWQ